MTNVKSIPQYNGNISHQRWGSSLSNVFTYQYDRLNRLTDGSTTAGGISMSEAMTYDVMGNIKTLGRDGGPNRLYLYNGNQLSHVEWVTNVYGYDGNGNATTDGHNGMALNYNHLNLQVYAGGGYGLTIHALQDAYAHKGTDMDNHDVWNDRFGDTSGAERISTSAVTVFKLLSGDYSGLGNKIDISTTGMSKEQLKTVMSSIKDYMNYLKKKEEDKK